MIDLNKARADLGDRAKDLTDEQLAKRLYKGFGLSAPFEQVAKPLFGFDTEDNAKRRIGQFVDDTQSQAFGLAGLAADVVGADSVREWAKKGSERNALESAQKARFTDDITNFGKEGFDMGAYTRGSLAYVGANVLPSVVTGGLGALGFRALAKAGAEKLAKQTVESATKRGLSKELLDTAKDEIGEKVRNQALKQAAKKGAAVGSFAGSYAQSAGGLYADLGGEDPNAVAKSLGYAAPIAALDTVAEISAVKGLLGGSKPSSLVTKAGDGLLKNTARVTGRVAGGAARQGTIEGGTEVLQGGIERFAKNEDVLDKNAMINEFALGALGGGSVGTVSSAINRGESAELTMKAKEYAVKTRDDVLNTTFQNQTNALNKQFERDDGSAAELSGFQPSGKTVAENATNVTPDAQDDTEDLITTFGATPFRNTAGALSRVDIGGRSYLGKEANSTLDTLRKVRTQFGDYGTKYVTSFIEPNVKAPTVSQMFSDLKNLGVTPDAPVEDVVPLVDGLINQAADIRNIDKRNQRIDSLTRFKSAITGQAPVAATPPVATPAQPASPVRTADDEAFNSFVDDLNAQEERRNAQNAAPANEGGAPVQATTPVTEDRALDLEDENDILIALLQKRTAKSTRQEAENAVNLLFENPEAQKESAAAEGLTLDQYKQRLKRFKQFLGIGGNDADRAVKQKKLQELATELGVPFEAVERSIARLREAGTQGTNNFGTDSTIDGTIEDASQGLSLSDIKARLDTALAALPEEERSKVESDPTVYSEFVQKQLTKDELAIVNRAQIQKETTQTSGDMESINGSTENAEGDSKAIVNIRSSANQTAYASDLEKRLAEGKDDASKKMTKAVAEVERSKKELIAAIAADNDQDAIDAAQKRFDDALDNLTGSSEDYVNSAKPNAKDLADINKGFESLVDKVKGEVEGAYSGISTTEAPTAKSVAAPETTVVERELTKIVGRQQAYKIGDKTITLRLADAGITYGKLSAYPDIIEKVRVSVEKGTLVNDLPAIAEAFASKVKRSVVKDGQPDESSLLLAAMMDAKYRVAKPAAERKVKALRKRLVETYQRMGLETAFLDAVDSIEVGNLAAYNAEGAYFSGDTSIMLDALFVERASDAEILGVMHHEVGHAFDFMFDDAQFSSDPLFNVRANKNDKLVGPIMDELAIGSVWSDRLGELLRYPLETFKKDNLKYDEVRAEIFAQLWRGMFDTKMADAFDASVMPKVMAFLEGAVSELKNYGESAGDSELRTESRSNGSRPQEESGSGQPTAGKTSGTKQTAYRSASSGSGSSGTGNVPRGKSGVIDYLPESWRPMLSSIAQTVGYYADRAGNVIMNTRDLGSRAQKLMPTAKEIARLFDAKQSMVNSLEKKYRELYAQYAVLDEPIKAKLDKVIFEATRLQDNDYQLGSKYSALPKEAQAIVDAVFEMGKNELVTKRDSIISQIDALIAKTEDDRTKRSLETSKTDLTEQYKKLLKGPYAPLSRFGNFVVVAKSAAYIEAERNEDASKLKKLRSSGKDYYVSYFDSVYEANRQRQELQKEGFVDVPEPFRKDDLRAEMFAGPVVLDTINKMKAEVPEPDGDNKLEIASAKRLNNLLDQLYLSTLAEDSIRGYRMNREGVAGNVNMMQAFFARGQAESRFMSNLVYNPQLNEVFRKLKVEADKGDSGTKQERREYYLELLARHADDSGAPNSITSGIMKMNSLQFLSLNPGYYLTNLTQVPVMTVPFLAGRFGYAKAWRETFKAYGEVAGMLRNAKFNEQPSVDKLPDDIRDFAKMMLDEGWMENSAINDLGNIEFETKGAASKAAKKADLFLRELQLKTETINRVTSAFAAYRLAVAKGEDGVAAARETINRTQGDYSDFNAPRFMRGNVGRIATQFRKYQIMQLGTMATLFADWRKNSDPKEAAIAGRQLAFMLGHAAVMGGVKGLPMVSLIAALMFKGDDEEAEEEIIKLVGEDMGVLLTRGMPAYMGLDVSGRVGFGNTFSLFPYTDYDLDKKSGWEKLALAMFGPTGATFANMGEGFGAMRDGEFYRGALMAAPSGVANILKSLDYQGEGVVNRRGEVQISSDDLTAMDSIAKALGFPTTKVAMNQFYTRRANDLKQTYQEQENTLRRQYVDAFKDKDADTMTELRDQWREIQLEKREKGIKVNPLSNLIKSPSNERERANVKSDGVRVPEGFEGYVRGIRG